MLMLSIYISIYLTFHLIIFNLLLIYLGIHIENGERMEMSPSYNIQVTADQNFQSDEKEKVELYY